jgi:Spy/CpxP family protein refolding chaperone
MSITLKRTLLALLSAGCLATAIASDGHHSSRHGDRIEHQQKMMERFAHKLDLNASQKDKLRALSEALSKQRQIMHGDSGLKSEMLGLISGNKMDRSKALELAQSKTRAMQEAAPLVVNASADFYDSLNPEQQTKVREWMEKRKHWGSRG